LLPPEADAHNGVYAISGLYNLILQERLVQRRAALATTLLFLGFDVLAFRDKVLDFIAFVTLGLWKLSLQPHFQQRWVVSWPVLGKTPLPSMYALHFASDHVVI